MTTGDWIYPRSLEIYKLMEHLAAQNYLTPYVQIYCPGCKNCYSYKTISEIPAKIVCPNCGYCTNTIDNARVVYRVN